MRSRKTTVVVTKSRERNPRIRSRNYVYKGGGTMFIWRREPLAGRTFEVVNRVGQVFIKRLITTKRSMFLLDFKTEGDV
jgi:hypothetical protein